MTDPLNVRVTTAAPVVVRVTAGGPPGQQGPPGSDSVDAFYYEFVQTLPSLNWVVHHALGRYPSVAVILDDGTVAFGLAPDHLSVDELVIAFEEPTSGRAICS